MEYPFDQVCLLTLQLCLIALQLQDELLHTAHIFSGNRQLFSLLTYQDLLLLNLLLQVLHTRRVLGLVLLDLLL